METTISLPFKVTSYGTISSTTEQSKIWSDRVRSVIGTNLNERILRPEFGTLVPESFMQTQDDAETMIRNEVERGFAKFLDLLTLASVEVSFDEYTATTNVIITYDLPNNEQTTTTVSLFTVVGTLPSTQENL
jgi:phage baseplate assembly protein W